MKPTRLVSRITVALVFCALFASAEGLLNSDVSAAPSALTARDHFAYAVVIKQSTYDDPAWQAVADALLARYQGQLFIWDTALNDVQEDMGAYEPTHIGFVCEHTTVSQSFVQYTLWPFTRHLDEDIYCDAIWGILTGYDAEDALNLATGPEGFEVKTVLGGTTSCDLAYYTQGISTSEATYNRYYVKHPDSLGTTTFDDGPTDRTEWLVTMINEGIDIFDYDPVDIMYTSGHGNYNNWQLHYPSPDLEGFFRSSAGQVYGAPHSGPDININSTNPKIYFGLGNCYIGKILGSGSMAPSWIHTGGAHQYTGYVIAEGSTSYQHGATKAYFYKAGRQFTWAEAFYLGNQALRFDKLNLTPGANPPDKNGSALYGNPAMQALMSHEGVYQEPLFSTELLVTQGSTQDTVTFRMTMNRSGNPGYTSKWGERHPATILPFRARNPEVISTDAMQAVVMDDFVLLYVWHQGQVSLAEGDTREVVFTTDRDPAGVDEDAPAGMSVPSLIVRQNDPNPFGPSTRISYTLPERTRACLQVFDISGRLVECIVDRVEDAGEHSVVWDTGNAPSGPYFYKLSAGGISVTKRCVALK
ncbi:MAG: T9SS type A sorting domain-containing protein [Candidatus Eisenbacteria sp.]|nr:T9SS type A sorting domain-containing protein [Candidatus Eisenbacteria bacterium]